MTVAMLATRRFKRMASQAAFRLATVSGRYTHWSWEAQQVEQREAVRFEGDVPPMAGQEHDQRRMAFCHPRPLASAVSDLVYRPIGTAWVEQRLERRYSFEEVGLRQLLDLPRGGSIEYPQATILQAQTPRTYGDWFSEHVAVLALALEQGRFVAPLLLPRVWYDKPYVQRDLKSLSVEAEPVDRQIVIRNATVLGKQRPGHYWTRQEAMAVLRAMHIVPRGATPGTALYLSRLGERGEGPRRQINNALVEEAMQACGVRVVRTVGRSLEDFMALADQAETVFADHGSALYNVLHWRTRRVVELYTPDYWDSAFLFLLDALAVRDYHLWRIDQSTSVAGLSARIQALMERPLAPPAAS